MDPKVKEVMALVQAHPGWAEAVEMVRRMVREELGPSASFAEFETAVQTMMEAVTRVAVEEMQQEQGGRAVTSPGVGKRRRKAVKG